MKKYFALLLVLACAPAFAVDSAETSLRDKLAGHWKTSKEYTLAIAEQMPAESYSFKPNADEMTFGEQMAHIAGANLYFMAIITDAKPPADPKEFGKTAVIQMLNESFDAFAKSMNSLTAEQLKKTYKTPDGAMSGLEAIQFSMDHTTHHRGQCIVYLRVKGIKPADYRF
jgi:uncharacterized damage-inducible protein DinB